MLKRLGFSHISARPQHPAQDAEATTAFKKNFPTLVAEVVTTLAPATPIEVWFEDEMRIGQKNGLVYQWAKKGTRPRQPKDQRYKNPICSARSVRAAIPGSQSSCRMPTPKPCRGMLTRSAWLWRPGAHALIILDKAAWHTTSKLKLPDHLTLVPLPPACLELNAAENIWQYLRQTYLSNRLFENYTAILDACQFAWRSLLNELGRIKSIASRDWAAIG